MNKAIIAAGISLLLAACGGSNSTSNGEPRNEVEQARAGEQKHVVLSSAIDGADISFELFEPDQLEPGVSYPLVLHGHGYGGSRITSRDGFVARLTAAGYYVISIDQRGFGESGGTVRVLSPDFEGQDLLQILDWAEALPGLARDGGGNMQLGAYGGSYGGGYQLLILGADPQNRLDALAPDITWNDLRYALSPNEVVKSGWVLALAAGGEQGSNLGQDNFIRESLVQGTLENRMPQAAKNLFAYHSPVYHCEGQAFQDQSFLIATSDPGNVPSRQPPVADILLTQGTRDTLFNFNEAQRNFECYKNLGGDVRLLTHESGHILPVALPEEIKDGIDPLYSAVNFPEFQDGGGARDCGSLNLNDVQFAWFEEKLKGQSGAVDELLNGHQVCMSLGAGDAIALDDVPVGGERFALEVSIPQMNSVLGVAGSLLGNGLREVLLADVPLLTAGENGAVIAGVPTMALRLDGLSGLEMEECATSPLDLGCDPILFLGLSVRRSGESRYELIDDQLTPIRGFGDHGTVDSPMQMTGIAERLQPGDSLALQIYAFHAQFPVTWSRDLFVPASALSGELYLPLLGGEQILAEGL